MIMRMMLATLFLSVLGTSCEKDVGSKPASPVLIDTTGRFEHSNLAGNLMATAIKSVAKVDIAFYPSQFLESDKFAIIDNELTPDIIENRILPLYPSASDKDQFQVGSMRGSEIRKFILNRTTENYRLDLQTAGLEYDIQFLGGLPTVYQINLTHGVPLVDDQYYRVAISDYYYYNADTFPGYRYRNGLEQRFLREPDLYSAKAMLKTFLTGFKTLPLIDEIRASIRSRTRGSYPEPLTISQIQGVSHLSPYYGYRVTTKGILTAVARPEHTTGMELYLQSAENDNDPRTSSALNIYLANQRSDLVVGQEIEVAGIVTEIMTYQGMTRTAIREVDSFKILSAGNPLPEPILLGGTDGLKVPNKNISSYRGNLNQKTDLNLEDAIDFWESLEGMRIKLAKPTVVGFRGGKEKFDEPKTYITVYVTPEGASDPASLSDIGGIIPDAKALTYNPEVVRIVDSDLAPHVKAAQIFNSGDKFDYDLEGILSYQTNTFGDGEFVMFVTGQFNGTSALRQLEARPRTKLIADDDHLTVASYNVENLAGNRTARIQEIAKSISLNLACPDIVVLPEIQDFNGPSMVGGSSAEKTLAGLLGSLSCDDAASYRALNIDPIAMQDGGEPGGNIRVAMIYNSKRVGFVPKGHAEPLDETTVNDQGDLNQNPGRVYPNDNVFFHSRKPLVAEFTFKGEKVFVIGNHLNSKLSDGNLWGVEQPLNNNSEVQRSLIAKKVNQFVARLIKVNPGTNVIVCGDMNAYWNETSMQVLAGKNLKNLMTYANLYPSNQWYSINFNGGTASIDHILANDTLLTKEPEFEIVHINSIFMNKASDHDPAISRFKF